MDDFWGWWREQFRLCRRPMFGMLGSKGGYCQRLRRHPGICCIDADVAAEMDNTIDTR